MHPLYAPLLTVHDIVDSRAASCMLTHMHACLHTGTCMYAHVFQCTYTTYTPRRGLHPRTAHLPQGCEEAGGRKAVVAAAQGEGEWPEVAVARRVVTGVERAVVAMEAVVQEAAMAARSRHLRR